MDLRNYQITAGEVLANPAARAVLQREIPALLRHPMLPMAKNMRLVQLLNMNKGVIPPAKVKRILEELEKA